jgi:hypothetical protein
VGVWTGAWAELEKLPGTAGELVRDLGSCEELGWLSEPDGALARDFPFETGGV